VKESSLRFVRFVLSWAILVAYVWVLYRLMTGNVAVPQGVSDKTAHAVAFGVLAVLAYWAFGALSRSAIRTAAVSCVVSSLYGLFGEYAQSRIPTRHADVHDFYADTLGAVIGTLLVLTVVALARLRNAAKRRSSRFPYERTHRA
jgi:VanZ family protein